ncbi:MAG: phenylalanine--tRNA ligase subunit beta, partial [Flavobacteriaceae bacterium]
TPYVLEQNIAKKLVGQGFQEVINNSITNPGYAKISSELDRINKVTILNPLGQELSQMRSSILFSLLEVIVHNQNRQQRDLKIYEFGKVYSASDTGYVEAKKLALAICGKTQKESWNGADIKADFFYLKGSVMALFDSLGLDDIKENESQRDLFSAGIEITARKKSLAHVGIVKAEILTEFDIDQEVIYAEIDFDALFEVAFKNELIVQAIPKFPSSRRDFALLIDEEISFKQLKDTAKKVERKILKHINLFDVYQGKSLPKGKKSYGISFHFEDLNKTLTDKYIDKVMAKLKHAFEKEFGASLR